MTQLVKQHYDGFYVYSLLFRIYILMVDVDCLFKKKMWQPRQH